MHAFLGIELRVASALLLGVAILLVHQWWTGRRRAAFVRRQLRSMSVPPRSSAAAAAELLRPNEAPVTGWIRAVFQRLPLLRDSERLLEQAGLDMAPRAFAKLTIGSAAVACAVVFLATGVPTAAGVGLAAGGFLPVLLVLRKRARRLRAMEEQLPEVIDLLTRAVRGGHAMPTAVRMIAEEGPSPLAGEFRRVFEEQKYGFPFEEALLGLARRADLVDVRVMCVAILIQREVGGNLTEILENIAALVRSRFTMRRQLQVHAAQGRASGYVLGILPIAVAGLILLLNPSYLSTLLSDELGKSMLTAAVVLQLLGYVWIWRILKIEF